VVPSAQPSHAEGVSPVQASCGGRPPDLELAELAERVSRSLTALPRCRRSSRLMATLARAPCNAAFNRARAGGPVARHHGPHLVAKLAELPSAAPREPRCLEWYFGREPDGRCPGLLCPRSRFGLGGPARRDRFGVRVGVLFDQLEKNGRELQPAVPSPDPTSRRPCRAE